MTKYFGVLSIPLCVSEGLNIVNAAVADRQVVMEMSSGVFWRVNPPPPSLQSIVCVWPPPGTHARLG